MTMKSHLLQQQRSHLGSGYYRTSTRVIAYIDMGYTSLEILRLLIFCCVGITSSEYLDLEYIEFEMPVKRVILIFVIVHLTWTLANLWIGNKLLLATDLLVLKDKTLQQANTNARLWLTFNMCMAVMHLIFSVHSRMDARSLLYMALRIITILIVRKFIQQELTEPAEVEHESKISPPSSKLQSLSLWRSLGIGNNFNSRLWDCCYHYLSQSTGHDSELPAHWKLPWRIVIQIMMGAMSITVVTLIIVGMMSEAEVLMMSEVMMKLDVLMIMLVVVGTMFVVAGIMIVGMIIIIITVVLSWIIIMAAGIMIAIVGLMLAVADFTPGFARKIDD